MHNTVTIKINDVEFKVSQNSFCQMEDGDSTIDIVFLKNEDYFNIYQELGINKLEEDGEEIELAGMIEDRELILANWEEEIFCEQCQTTTVHNPVMSEKASVWSCGNCGTEVSL